LADGKFHMQIVLGIRGAGVSLPAFNNDPFWGG